ncbi:MAG TPA: nucleoside hydrolase [Pararobbsia sp.]|nr:nucleoside hydrolase [Pararobbsia sp.]
MSMHKVIYDTDPGVDDAMALLFQVRHPDIELLGVTTVFGNATIEMTTRNALYLTGKFAPHVPVARGAAAPLVREAPGPLPFIHGNNGVGDIDLPADEALGGTLDPRPAHRFIVDTVRAHPGEVTLIAVGPMTNLALALAEAPEIAGLVKQVVIMGGAFGYHGILGNVSPAAEANIFNDPHAADQIFNAAWPLTIVGLDVTERTIMTAEYLSALRDAAGDDGQFLWDVSRVYHGFHLKSEGLDGIFVHDSSAVAFVVRPDLYTTRSGPVRVMTEGLAIGQAIQKPLTMPVPNPNWDGRPAMAVCIDVDAAGMLELYRSTLTHR